MPSLDPRKEPDASGDDASPTTKVRKYLSSKGLQPTAENTRRALSENARNPGLIEGLRNEEPPAADSKGSSTSRSNSSSSGNRSTGERSKDSAPKSKGSSSSSSLPTPPIPPDQAQATPNPTTGPVIGGGSPTNVQLGNSDGAGIQGIDPLDLAAAILGGAGATGLGLYGYSRFGNRQPGAEFVGNAGPQPFRMPTDIVPYVDPGVMAATGPTLLTDQRMPPQLGVDQPIDLAPRQNQFPPRPQSGAIGMTDRGAIPMPDQTSGPVINLGDQSAGKITSAPPTDAPMSSGWNLLPEDALSIQTQPRIGPQIATEFIDAPPGMPVDLRTRLSPSVGGAAGASPGILEDLFTFIRGAGARR